VRRFARPGIWTDVTRLRVRAGARVEAWGAQLAFGARVALELIGPGCHVGQTRGQTATFAVSDRAAAGRHRGAIFGQRGGHAQERVAAAIAAELRLERLRHEALRHTDAERVAAALEGVGIRGGIVGLAGE
jgi:hypothetical protein